MPSAKAPFASLLGTTIGGVQVFSCHYPTAPFTAIFRMNSYHQGVFTGVKYQCVELARRYLLINHGVVFDSVHMAYEIFQLKHVFQPKKPNGTFPMTAHPNGAVTRPLTGSLLIWQPKGFFKSTGHVAIVIEAKEDHVDIAEQNVHDTVWPEGQAYSRRLRAHVDEQGGYHVQCSYSDAKLLGWMNIDYKNEL